MILQRVTPVTHSIGNCVKRVIVIIASVLVFQNPMSLQNKIGNVNPYSVDSDYAHSGDYVVVLKLHLGAVQELLSHFLGSSATLKLREWVKRRLHKNSFLHGSIFLLVQGHQFWLHRQG